VSDINYLSVYKYLLSDKISVKEKSQLIPYIEKVMEYDEFRSLHIIYKYYKEFKSFFTERYFIENNIEFEYDLSEIALPSLADVIKYLNDLIIRNVNSKALNVMRETFDYDELVAKIRKIYIPTRKSIDEEFFEWYEFRKSCGVRILSFLDVVDRNIIYIEPGSIFTVGASPGHGKTSYAIYCSHSNAVKLGYNVVYITGEVSKNIIISYLLSCHSAYLGKPIEFNKITKCLLFEEEIEILKETYDDLFNNSKYGKIKIVEFSELNDLSSETVYSYLDGFDVDLIVLDYFQIARYLTKKITISPGDTVLDYLIRDYQQAVLNWGGKKIVLIGLSQVSREGQEFALNHDGEYELRHLSNSNEIEKSSSYVMFLWYSAELRDSGQIKVQLKKNRMGEIMLTPANVMFNPSYFLFESSIVNNFESMSINDLLKI